MVGDLPFLVPALLEGRESLPKAEEEILGGARVSTRVDRRVHRRKFARRTERTMHPMTQAVVPPVKVPG